MPSALTTIAGMERNVYFFAKEPYHNEITRNCGDEHKHGNDET
jgi:hypothetical protein